MGVVTEDLLREMVAAIVQAADPERIILFGSHARGDPPRGGEAAGDSDLDLLIVKDRPFGANDSRRRVASGSFEELTRRGEEMARLWRLLARFPVPQDILIFTPQEVERWRATKNHVIARALREGKVLYERS